MLLKIDLHVHVRTCANTLFFFFQWNDLRKTQQPLAAVLVSLGPLLWFSKDSSRPPPLFSSSSPSLFLPRFSVTFKINVTCRKANQEKKKCQHMAKRMPINCNKVRKRILCRQTAVGVGDLQGSFFFPVSIRRGLSSRHQKALATLLEWAHFKGDHKSNSCAPAIRYTIPQKPFCHSQDGGEALPHRLREQTSAQSLYGLLINSPVPWL